MLSNEFVLALLIGGLLQESWSRTVSITLNLNLDLAKNEPSKISADMVQNCIKRTEVGMNELTRFRLGLISNSLPFATAAGEEETMFKNAAEDYDDEAENKENNVDYSIVSPIVIIEKYQEPIQCFAHCLYEQMGLIKDGVFMESAIQRKLNAIMVREQVQLPECVDMESENKCEAAYKLHLCYSKLKLLEYESNIRTLVVRKAASTDTLKNVTDDNESGEAFKEN